MDLERRITVTGDYELGAVRISETGYVEVGHKNKNGRDYPAQPAETGLYSGRR